MRFLPSRNLLGNAAVLGSGTALAQVVTIAAAPVLSRLFTPQAFGVLGLFNTLATILAAVVCLRYEQAIVLPRTRRAAVALAGCCACATLALAALVALSTGMAGPAMAAALGEPGLEPLLWLLAPLTLVLGAKQVLTFWSLRRVRFRTLAGSRVGRSAATLGVQLSTGLAGWGAVGLVAGQVCGQVAEAGVLVWSSGRDLLGLAWDHLRWDRLRAVARRYRRFPLFGAPQALLNASSQNLPVLLLGLFFSTSVVGSFWFVQRLLALPADLVGQAVRQAFLQRAAALRNEGGDLVGALLQVTLVLSLVAVPMVLLLVAAGPVIFRFVFGGEWDVAGQYSRWLALWAGTALANVGCVALVVVWELQRELLIWDAALLLARALAIGVGGWRGDDLLAMALFAGVGVVFNLALIAYVFAVTRRRSAEGAE